MKNIFAIATRLTFGCLVLCGSAYGAPMAAFVPNDQPVGWVAPVEVTSFNFGLNGQTLFRGDYDKGNWAGNLTADGVDTLGSVTGGLWDDGAASHLDAQNWDTVRLIATMSGATKVAFRWANLSTAQKTAINTADSKDENNKVGQDILNYVRGNRSKEGTAFAYGTGTFRTRTSALGDIVHSRPLFVPDPALTTVDPTAADPNARVYVGGNDGTLHVFDACTNGCSTAGDEVYAYVPSMLLSNLKKLATSPYAHQYYVDGTPNAAKVKIGGASKTILVGGLGAGGKGLYALDITDPTATSESDVASRIKWEITPTAISGVSSNSYQNLGYTYGVPLIVTLNDGTAAAIVGNGYNSANGKAVLYVINIDTGALIRAIATTSDNTETAAAPNGLSTPAALDTDNDGKVDYVYAGDIRGNVWKFDLRSNSSGNWPAPIKFFANPTTAANTNAILGAPSIALNSKGGRQITFGTGRLFTYCTTGTCDQTDTTQQYVYGVRDTDFPAASVTALTGTVIDTSKLVSQTMSSTISYTGNTIAATVRTPGAINAVDYTTKHGWRLSLASGERVLGDGAYIKDGRYQFATANPNKSNGTNTDGTAKALGDNWLVEVDFLTGTAPATPFLDLNASRTLDDDDLVANTGQASKQLRVPIARQISIGGVISQPILAQLAFESQTYFNINPDVAATSATNNNGVTNGHFDYDIYYNTCSTTVNERGKSSFACAHNTHKHQYDDIYNVTGVDMLNASLPTLNLINAIPSATTNFKILIANQKLSPGVQIKLGDASATYMSTWLYPATTATVGGTPSFVSQLTTYNRSTLKNLVVNMPLNAFTAQDWLGNGSSVVGLVPTVTTCVHANDTGSAGRTTSALLPYGGLWMNGALTIQLIKNTTPDSAIEMAVVGDTKFGYRLKEDNTSQANQLAMWTMFWHHPNQKCYGVSGWGTTQAIAYADTASSATASAKAAGSTDPTEGLFVGTGGSTGTGGTTSGSNVSSSTITLPDGTIVTQTITKNADGTYTITLVGPDGTTTFTLDTQVGGLQHDTRVKSGRLSWKELVRP